MTEIEREPFVRWNRKNSQFGLSPDVTLIAAFAYEENLANDPTRGIFDAACKQAEDMLSDATAEDPMSPRVWLPRKMAPVVREAIETGIESMDGLVLPVLTDPQLQEDHPGIRYAERWQEISQIALRQLDEPGE